MCVLKYSGPPEQSSPSQQMLAILKGMGLTLKKEVEGDCRFRGSRAGWGLERPEKRSLGVLS